MTLAQPRPKRLRRGAEPGRSVVGRPSLASRIVAHTTGGILQVILLLVGVLWLIPTLGLFITSLRTPDAISDSGWWTALIHPSELTFSDYSNLFHDSGMMQSLVNTILITVPATIGVVVIASLAAYAFAWIDFRGRDWLFVTVIGLLVVPLQVALIPVAKMYKYAHLFGTIPGVVLFHIGFGLPFAIFLLRNFFSGIPRELLEAARMEGGTEWVIFRKVIVPLGKPAIASLAIFQFLWVWNDMLVALVFSSTDTQPLTVELQGQMRQFGSNLDILAPGAFLSLVIPLLVFFSFQRYFVQGLMAGSVKG